ncbi:hypothetical protein ACFLZY_00255 [Patescibacteria group bacterium]
MPTTNTSSEPNKKPILIIVVLIVILGFCFNWMTYKRNLKEATFTRCLTLKTTRLTSKIDESLPQLRDECIKTAKAKSAKSEEEEEKEGEKEEK